MQKLLIGILWFVAVPALADAPAGAPADAPTLTVDALYGTEQKVDFDGPDPPTTRWIQNDQHSQLVVLRKGHWQQVSLPSGRQRPWALPADWANQLETLPGVDAKAAREALNRVIEADDLPDLQRLAETGLLVPILDGLAIVGSADGLRVVTRDARGWQHATLSPDGQWVAYVQGNDLYVVRVASGRTLRLTDDGSDTRLNGTLDWTYQEEIYGRGNFKAFHWSPDSRRIALLRIDISRVFPYTLADSQTPRGQTLVTRYPKAGDPIPRAQLWIASVDGPLVPVHTPVDADAEQLVVRFGWRSDGQRLHYQITDRIQSWMELRDCGAGGGDVRTLLREAAPTWLEVLGQPQWVDAETFLWLSDLPAGRRRLWRVSADGRQRVPLTPDDFDVREVVQICADQGWAIVSGDRQRGTVGQQIYRVSISDQADATLQPLTTEPGWHDVRISGDCRWMVDAFSTLTEPPAVTVHAIGPWQKDGDRQETDDRGAVDPPPVRLFKSHRVQTAQPLVAPRWLELETETGLQLPGYLIPPAPVAADERSAADEGSAAADERRFPVLIETYGGPLAPSAVDRWTGTRYLYRQLLAQQGIGVLVVDNRSSAGRGIGDSWSIHRRMGVVELQDLLLAVDWLHEQPWVDEDRIGLRGWSFGGFLTAYAMTRSDAFAAGVAGGSPTDWRNYDAIYTERYMGLPADNPEGYRETSVLQAADKLHGRLLLIHGELDDNVHPANTLQLVAALQRANKQFDLMLYPGAAHGVTKPEQVHHMMRMVTRFLRQHLRPPTVP